MYVVDLRAETMEVLKLSTESAAADLFSGVGAILNVAVAAHRHAEANVAPETMDAFLAWSNMPHFREVLQTEQRASFRERGENRVPLAHGARHSHTHERDARLYAHHVA